MINSLARRVAVFCLNKEWITDEMFPWLIYSIERRLHSGVFYCCAVIIGAASHSLLKIAIFIFPFLFFRSKLGGWHASSPMSCLLLSLGILTLSIFYIGPTVGTMPIYVILGINICTLFALWKSKPAYPKSAHFGSDVVAANNRIKNHTILPLALIQFLSLIHNSQFLVYSSVAIISVLILLHIQTLLNNHGGKNE